MKARFVANIEPARVSPLGQVGAVMGTYIIEYIIRSSRVSYY